MKSILMGVFVFCWLMIIFILGGVPIDGPNHYLGVSLAVSTIMGCISAHLLATD